MSGPEHFLTRWSRRKRNAAEQPDTPAAPATADRAAREQPSATPESSPPETEPKVDLASLPPLESIGAGSDIRAFLQAGVPGELTRAALRRAWTSDPTIRDFIGLSENSWDFTAPDGVPGFGPLQPAENIRRMVAEIIGEVGKAAEPQAPAAAEAAEIARDSKAEQDAASEQAGAEIGQAGQKTEVAELIVHRKEDDVAAQRNGSEADKTPRPSRRSHGGALPE